MGTENVAVADEALDVLRQDPVMADLVERHDPYTETDWDEFERLCVSIINQQLSTASAAAIKERVYVVFDGEITPTRVLDVTDEPLLEAGLSQTKVEYMRNAARAFEADDLTRSGLDGCSNDEVVDKLTEIKGIGDWTARMYLLFVLERPDILPLGDLAVRNGIEELYGDGDGMTRAEMRAVAENWRPYRSVATRYIWAEYESDG